MAMPRCPLCQGALVEITLTLADKDLAMRSCSTCDRRWWLEDGELVDFDGVVPEARRPRIA
jgi:hypothetical protein